jgi:hypothetical protein
LSIKHISKVILFADDAGLLVTDKNYEQFKRKAYSMSCLGEWFDKNQLVLNITETNLVKFTSAKGCCRAVYRPHKPKS